MAQLATRARAEHGEQKIKDKERKDTGKGDLAKKQEIEMLG